MNVLSNTLRLLRESFSDFEHYLEQVELILKEKETEEKQVGNVKEENKKKKPL